MILKTEIKIRDAKMILKTKKTTTVENPRQARVLLRRCVDHVHEAGHALPRTADVRPHPRDVEPALVEAGRRGAVCAQQLVCENLSLVAGDVVRGFRNSKYLFEIASFGFLDFLH